MKKIFLMALSVCLVAALSIGGTMAYLTSEDSDVNVMTLGNVKIKQHEYERVVNADGTYQTVTTARGEGYKLKEFSQAKPLYPVVGDTNGGYDSTVAYLEQIEAGKADGYMRPLGQQVKNVQDKVVLVENTGKSDTYVRTVFAFELGDVAVADWGNKISYVYNGDDWTWNWLDSAVEIDGNKYIIAEAVYVGWDGRHANGVLPADEYTYLSLGQVYMKSSATNEDCVALDGNNNGTYDILVLSQAIQTEGFADAKTALDTGFGTFNETNVKDWFGDIDEESNLLDGTVVYTFKDLEAAMKQGGTVIVGNDIVFEYMIDIPAGVDVYLHMNGMTLDTEIADPAIKMHNDTDLVIDGNGTFDIGGNTGANLLWPNGDVNSSITIKNGTFIRDAGDNVNNYGFPFIVGNKTCKVVIEDGYFDGGYYKEGDCEFICKSNMNMSTNQPYVIYGGTFVGQNPAWGDEGKGAACPHCEKNGAGCQGTFLEGQKTTDEGIPSTYTIVEGVTADGRPTYTVIYNK